LNDDEDDSGAVVLQVGLAKLGLARDWVQARTLLP